MVDLVWVSQAVSRVQWKPHIPIRTVRPQPHKTKSTTVCSLIVYDSSVGPIPCWGPGGTWGMGAWGCVFSFFGRLYCFLVAVSLYCLYDTSFLSLIFLVLPGRRAPGKFVFLKFDGIRHFSQRALARPGQTPVGMVMLDRILLVRWWFYTGPCNPHIPGLTMVALRQRPVRHGWERWERKLYC